jgi:hypothetical protein
VLDRKWITGELDHRVRGGLGLFDERRRFFRGVDESPADGETDEEPADSCSESNRLMRAVWSAMTRFSSSFSARSMPLIGTAASTRNIVRPHRQNPVTMEPITVSRIGQLDIAQSRTRHVYASVVIA